MDYIRLFEAYFNLEKNYLASTYMVYLYAQVWLEAIWNGTWLEWLLLVGQQQPDCNKDEENRN